MMPNVHAVDVLKGPEPAPRPAGRLAFAFLGGPVAWTLHLLITYFLVSYRAGLGDAGLRLLLLVVTVVLAGVAAAAALVGWREWTDDGPGARSFESAATRSNFLARSGVLMGVLFGIATIAEFVPVLVLSL